MARPTRALVAAGALALALAVCAAAIVPTRVSAAADPAVTAALDRISNRVLDYYRHAQSIVSTETVVVEQLGDGLAPSGPARRLVYDLRVEWNTPDGPDVIDARPEPVVVRRLLTVNGRPPAPEDENHCLDPGAGQERALEPLFMLLPEHRKEFGFFLGRPQAVDGRQANTIDYITLPVAGSGEASGSGDCASISLEGKTRGRIWVDPGTDDVMKLDTHLVGIAEVPLPAGFAPGSSQRWIRVERYDFSVKYAPVQFADPDETVMLPVSIETLKAYRTSSVSRVRVTQTYSGYQRFVTKSRMIPVGAADK